MFFSSAVTCGHSAAFARWPALCLQSLLPLTRGTRYLQPEHQFRSHYNLSLQQKPNIVWCSAIALPESITAGVFAASTVYTLALGALMTLAPRWKGTQQIMRRIWSLNPLALAYGLLLGCSWEPDTLSLILPGSWEEGFKAGFNPQFFPELRGIMALFSRAPTAASLWVHLLAINLFSARTAYLEGLKHSVPSWHSILLCLTLSPLGLLSHFVTQWLWKAKTRTKDSSSSPVLS